MEVTGSNPVAPTIRINHLKTILLFCVAPDCSNCSSMCLKSLCDGGSPFTRIAPWAVAIKRPSYGHIGTTFNHGWHFVLFGENCLHEPLLRLRLCFYPRLRVDLDREAGAGMAHEFLDDLYVLAIRDQ